ncbi:MAG: hypothetical protein NT037_01055 [Hyphomicrobiales bacterium]|nr:hypothetical protein [Hyphomicrobiales bacterium]
MASNLRAMISVLRRVVIDPSAIGSGVASVRRTLPGLQASA